MIPKATKAPLPPSAASIPPIYYPASSAMPKQPNRTHQLLQSPSPDPTTAVRSARPVAVSPPLSNPTVSGKQTPAISPLHSNTNLSALSTLSSPTRRTPCSHKDDKELSINRAIPQSWKLWPVPSYYAVIIVVVVLVYSAIFLTYAQRHSLMLVLMMR